MRQFSLLASLKVSLCWAAAILFAFPVYGESERLPIPGEDARKQASRLLQDTYGEKLDDCRRRDDQEEFSRIARQIFQTVEAPASKYVAFNAIRSQGASMGAIQSALSATDRLGSMFKVDSVRIRKETLSSLVRRAPPATSAYPELYSACLHATAEAVESDAYEEAEQFLRLALSCAGKETERGLGWQ